MPDDGDQTLEAPGAAKRLANRLAVDVTAAMTAVTAVSPIMTIIDRSEARFRHESNSQTGAVTEQ